MSQNPFYENVVFLTGASSGIGHGRLLQYLRSFIPALIDRIAARAIQQGR